MKLFAMSMLVAVYAMLMAGFMFGCSDGVCPAGWKTEPGHCMVPDGPKAGSSAVTRTFDDDPPQISEMDAGHSTVAEAGNGGTGASGNAADFDAGKPATACGDGLLSDDETCDPKSKSHPCPTADKCVSDGCTIATFSGSADACDAICETTAITDRINGDGCCPDGGDLATDSDCKPTCGNGKRESGELCDGDCPDDCDDGNPCTADRMIGSPGTCDALCVNAAVEEGSSCGADRRCDSDGKCLTDCTVGEPKCAGQGGVGSCVAGSTWMNCNGGKVCVATWIPAGNTCGPNLTCDEQHNCN